MVDEPLGLFDDQLDGVLGTDDLRDPGLHPRFRLFVANLLTGYLRFAPQRINALISAWVHIGPTQYAIAKSNGMLDDLVWAREIYLDSGGITPLLLAARGKGDVQQIWDWVTRTDDIVALAHRLDEYGCPPGVVCMLDLPAYKDALDKVGITVAQANDVTMANAGAMLHAELPHGWKAVYVSQGFTLAEHMACQDAYERMGILDKVRAGEAWLALGGMAFEKETERIHVICKETRKRLGEGHIHALGVNRLSALVPMIHRGWVQSADSSSPAQEVRFNRGPYRVEGPRPTFFWEACHAVSALYMEARLADALAKAEAVGLHEQTDLWQPEHHNTAPEALQRPTTPVSPPSGVDVHFEVHEPVPGVVAADGQCEQCGAELDREHTHAPWVTPDTAAALQAAGLWGDD
jgi:hypothetical protein